MIVNVYIDDKGSVLDTLVDESTSHRLGDIIVFEDDPNYQMIIVKIDTREHIDYDTIVHVNTIVRHDNSVDDIPIVELDGGINKDVQTIRRQGPT